MTFLRQSCGHRPQRLTTLIRHLHNSFRCLLVGLLLLLLGSGVLSETTSFHSSQARSDSRERDIACLRPSTTAMRPDPPSHNSTGTPECNRHTILRSRSVGLRPADGPVICEATILQGYNFIRLQLHQTTSDLCLSSAIPDTARKIPLNRRNYQSLS